MPNLHRTDTPPIPHRPTLADSVIRVIEGAIYDPYPFQPQALTRRSPSDPRSQIEAVSGMSA